MAGVLGTSSHPPRPEGPVRVVIVEDSVSVRTLLRHVLEADGSIQVVGEAVDPHQARTIIRKTDPDVVTLDVDLPHMNGISFLQKIMRLRPMPVIVLSALTPAGSALDQQARALGAVDCLDKVKVLNEEGVSILRESVHRAAQTNVHTPPTSTGQVTPSAQPWTGPVVLLGASTGGVDALEVVLAGLPKNGAPVLVVQHMTRPYLEQFAERLDRLVKLKVILAQDGQWLERGKAYIAPGGDCHMELTKTLRGYRICLRAGEPQCGHRPSVDALFRSAETFASQTIAVLLTGMGKDGADAMHRLHQAGAWTIVQDAETSVVHGMPGAALKLGAAEEVRPLERISDAILAQLKKGISPAKRHPNAEGY